MLLLLFLLVIDCIAEGRSHQKVVLQDFHPRLARFLMLLTSPLSLPLARFPSFSSSSSFSSLQPPSLLHHLPLFTFFTDLLDCQDFLHLFSLGLSAPLVSWEAVGARTRSWRRGRLWAFDCLLDSISIAAAA
ncbi:hypothetical protein V8C42DRAFT_315351 [Trichoderma barbatum]